MLLPILKPREISEALYIKACKCHSTRGGVIVEYHIFKEQNSVVNKEHTYTCTETRFCHNSKIPVFMYFLLVQKEQNLPCLNKKYIYQQVLQQHGKLYLF